MSQTEQILEHLKKRGTITSLEAYQSYGVTRLASRINDLKKQGQKISGIFINVPTRSGSTTVKQYYLVKG